VILDEILARTRQTVAESKARRPLGLVESQAAAVPEPRGFKRALARDGSGSGLGCIAEVKRRSPSAGWIREEADPADVAQRYAANGASAISVLTDEPFFGGSLAALRAVRGAVPTPLLRKDFVVDAYQIAEARAAGADAVLLIVAALDEPSLKALHQTAEDFGLDVLVEAHDEDEIQRAVDLGATLIGVNHRDLRTFQVDTTLATRMRHRIPSHVTVVAESGLRTAEDLQRMKEGAIDAILVGESLMRAADPGDALRELWGGFRPQ